MQRLRHFLILLLLPFSLFAQEKTKIIIQSWDATNVDSKKNITYLRNPVFRHENSTLRCDSAIFYVTENVFDAFKNVHIIQGDTINIYSDRLNYNGNTKIAHLTSNVRMVDRESTTLTTDILDYNMATKIGRYVEGGKIVSKDVTITSRNGYYFSKDRDAFFKYNVVAVTPETVIKSDTLRYNTLTNWTYFYGPTNIKGKDDNLYTENGAYNTRTQYAYFGKKNLYTEGAKSLKGDSLYYDGIKGYGKAVGNIIFRDTTDKTVMYGQLGFYYKKDERTLVTKNPYIGLGTADSIKVNDKLQPDSLWMGADTLETQMVLKKSLTLISSPVIKKDNELGEEEKDEKKVGATKPNATATEESSSVGKQTRSDRKNPKTGKEAEKKPPVNDKITLSKDSLPKDSLLKDTVLRAKADSVIKSGKDSISKTLKSVTPLVKAKADTMLNGKANANKIKAAATAGAKEIAGKIQGKQTAIKDTIPFNPEDTVRTRIIKAYHDVRVYKANMQAKADSLFYTAADSTLRWYRNPILWAEGSQQTGDTIYLQLKNKKLRTLQVIQNAFLVNVNADSARYNQIKGRLITAFFENGTLQNMFVDGNAESIYFNQNDKKVYTDMNQTVSSRIKILFKNKEITRIVTIREPEGVRTPIPELKEDVFLTGFTWKPELRPRSKKDVINGRAKAKPAVKKATPAAKGTTAKSGKATTTNTSTAIKNAIGTKGIETINKIIPAVQKNISPVLPTTKEIESKANAVKEIIADTVKAVPLKK